MAAVDKKVVEVKKASDIALSIAKLVLGVLEKADPEVAKNAEAVAELIETDLKAILSPGKIADVAEKISDEVIKEACDEAVGKSQGCLSGVINKITHHGSVSSHKKRASPEATPAPPTTAATAAAASEPDPKKQRSA